MKLWRRKNYRIIPREDEWTEPEETLVDSGSDLADLEAPVPEGIFRAGSFIIITLLAVLIGFAAYLMVGRYEHLAQLSVANRTISVAVPPPRGLILDRTGLHLVENVPSFDLLAISRQITHNSDGTFPSVGPLANALELDREELTLTLADNISENAVFFVATNITKEQALALTGDMLDGFYVITSTKRDYYDGEQFSTILGYVGKVSKADMSGDDYYLASDTIGRAGIESSYERVLRGTHGELSFQITDQAQQYAQQGNSVVLHLDAEAQKYLFNTTLGILDEAGLGEALAIVQDPQSGAVLSMVSFPSYNNDVFGNQLTQEEFSVLFENPQRPLFNRAIGGRYNPGSTIKPFIGMAALQDEVVQAGTTIPDCNAISIPNPSDPGSPYVFHNWRPEVGAFNLTRAIADSCNIYFFTVAGGHGYIDGLGIGRIVNFLREALANTLTGIDLPGEEVGFVPDPDWKWVTRKEPWYQGDTYNISIGQGDLVVTPIWINSYISAIANGGTLW
jgi:penicillin-binding protein 2